MAKVVENIHSDVRMSDVDAAYFAGFIDGEGTITTVRTKRAASRSGFRYQPILQVAQCETGVLEWLRSRCGNGRIVSSYTKKRQAFHRDLYKLTFSPHQIRHVLPQVMPYLRVKARQANLLMQFLDETHGWHLHQRPVDWQRLEVLHRSMHNLNPRGTGSEEQEDTLSVRPSRTGRNQYSKPSGSA